MPNALWELELDVWTLCSCDIIFKHTKTLFSLSCTIPVLPFLSPSLPPHLSFTWVWSVNVFGRLPPTVELCHVFRHHHAHVGLPASRTLVLVLCSDLKRLRSQWHSHHIKRFPGNNTEVDSCFGIGLHSCAPTNTRH